MQDRDYKYLIRQAFGAMKRAYTPYSGFQVGAALLTDRVEENGEPVIYMGCNIENAAYSPTNCAERTAFFAAVSEGERSFSAIAVVGGMHGNVTDYTTPCGVCRQVMQEFCDPDTFEIISAVSEEEYRVYKLRELLPEGFGGQMLQKKEEKTEQKGGLEK